MTHKHAFPVLAMSVTLTLAGCSEPDMQGTATSAASSAVATDRWLGQWNGPEGTFLRLEGGQGEYSITIRNLDGPQTYQARSDGTLVQFERNGVRETIRAASGTETGMKWLSDKSNCLMIRPGEGYCRE